MYNETTRLCSEGKMREAMEFVLRMKKGSQPSKTENLVFLANAVIMRFPKGKERDSYLAPIIKEFLLLRDVEHARTCLLAMHSIHLHEKYFRAVRASFHNRLVQWELVDNGL